MKTCLVVDDSRAVRQVARQILEDCGFQVAEAADGIEALKVCRTTMPQAILLDWAMPMMSGPEFLRRLRLEPGGQAARIIFCSADTDLARMREALEIGADEYIIKPFDSDIVQSKLALAGVS